MILNYIRGTEQPAIKKHPKKGPLLYSSALLCAFKGFHFAETSIMASMDSPQSPKRDFKRSSQALPFERNDCSHRKFPVPRAEGLSFESPQNLRSVAITTCNCIRAWWLAWFSMISTRFSPSKRGTP